MKVTPWFNGSVRPVYVGFYQRERNGIIIYSYWDGRFWKGNGAPKIEDAKHALRDYQNAKHQETAWRGCEYER